MNREIFIQKLEQIKNLTEECLSEISSKPELKTKRKNTERSISSLVNIDFDMNERAFIKKYSQGMGGPKKFVLVLAYLVKGKVGLEKTLTEIEKRWNKMTSLLKGKFNRYYSARAKENNWVDSRKSGFYFLTKNWKEIFIPKK
jgi:hypothetical protein